MARGPWWSGARRRYLLEAPLRRPWLVLVPGLVLALGAASIGGLLPARHRATALVAAQWQDGDDQALRQRGIDVGARRTEDVRQRATEPAALERVLRETQPYASAGELQPVEQQVERLLADLRVRPMSSTSYVVEFVHSDPAKATLVADRVIDSIVASAVMPPDAALEQLEARLTEARRVLESKAAALGRAAPSPPAALSDSADVPTPNEALFDERRAVAASLAAARSRAERLRQELEAQRSTATPDPRAAELERVRQELAELRKRYTEEHPDVERLRLRAERLEATLPREPSPQSSSRAELRATQAEIDELLSRQSRLDEQLASATPRPRPSPRDSDARGSRQQAVREHELAEQAYRQLLGEWQLAQDAARAARGAEVRFERLRAAQVPGEPEGVSLALLALVGALLGLMIGLVAALVAENRDRSVKGPEDLAEILPVPVLATLPLVRTRRRRK